MISLKLYNSKLYKEFYRGCQSSYIFDLWTYPLQILIIIIAVLGKRNTIKSDKAFTVFFHYYTTRRNAIAFRILAGLAG